MKAFARRENQVFEAKQSCSKARFRYMRFTEWKIQDKNDQESI